jgi:1-deoxyxylulose-5-phosphate synthase
MDLRYNVMIEGLQKPLSRLALGTAFYSLSELDMCFRIMDDFVSYGGTVIDSGRIYGDSEAVIGRWLQSRGAREDVLLITKGAHGADGLLPVDNLSGVIASELDTSLEMLGTDHIDLYMLHRDNPAIPVATIMDCLDDEVKRGRIRSFGLSNWTYSRLEEANECLSQRGIGAVAAVSNNLSLAVPCGPFYVGLVSTDIQGEQWHTQTNTPLLAWSSQARGFFTGKYLPTTSSADPFVARMIERYGSNENIERLGRAHAVASQKGDYTPVQIALAWLLHKSFPLIPIVGPQNPVELASCVQATSVTLSEREIGWLNLEDV